MTEIFVYMQGTHFMWLAAWMQKLKNDNFLHSIFYLVCNCVMYVLSDLFLSVSSDYQRVTHRQHGDHHGHGHHARQGALESEAKQVDVSLCS